MSNNTHLANFNGYPVEIVEHNGQKWITGEQIGKALGLKHPRQGITKIFNRHRSEITKAGATVTNLLAEVGKAEPNLGSPYKNQAVTIFSPRAARTIAFFCQTETAKRFREWVLDTLEQQEQPSLGNPAKLLQELLNARPLWRSIARYREMGLTLPEIGKLLDYSDATIRSNLRRMEQCGIIEPPKNLAQMQKCAKHLPSTAGRGGHNE